MGDFNLEQIRNDFPQLSQKVHGKPLVYLDNGATTLKCKPVIEAVNNHYANEVSNVHRGIHFLSQQGTDLYEQTRKAAQAFINAEHDHEVIFTKGTTDSINLVSQSFGEKYLNEGDIILVSGMEHHSNIVPWQLAAQKNGASVNEIPVLDSGELDMDAYIKLLSPKVKMVAVAMVSNTLGTVNPIKDMIRLAHQEGAKVLIDAAQGVSHIKSDVRDLDADFFVFSGHKMLGPTGIGILYGKEELLNDMPPYQGGGAMIDTVSFDGTTFAKLPEKFEAGTPHIAGVIGLKAAFDYLSNVGLETIKEKENELLEYATTEIKKIDGIRIIGEAANKCSVLSFVMDGAHPHDLGMILDQMGVAIRTGHHCTQPLMKRFNVPATARASFAFYNSKEDVDQLILALNKAKEML